MIKMPDENKRNAKYGLRVGDFIETISIKELREKNGDSYGN